MTGPRDLRLSRRALRDLDEIEAWIAAENPDAAEAVIGRIFDALRVIRDHPAAGSQRPRLGRDVRCVVADAYLAFYEPEGQDFVVIRILHGARDITRGLLRG